MASNNSRLYYLGGQDMVQSIHQASKSYSMQYDKESVSYSKPRMETKQDNTQQKKITEDKPIFLGENVFNRIKERYKQIKKIETNDVEVLYQFFMGMRKQSDEKNDKKSDQLKEKLMKSQNIPASSQRKLLNKLEFEKYLYYNPKDIYYTLHRQGTIIQKDRQLQEQLKKKKYFMEKYNSGQTTNTKKVNYKQSVNRLYPAQLTKNIDIPPEQKKHLDNMKFVFSVIQLYKNRKLGNLDYNVKKLYDFWVNIVDKEQLGLSRDSSQVQDLIKQYFYQQLQTLVEVHENKKGFLCQDTKTLLKFYKQLNAESLAKYGINIDQQCFNVYIDQYNKRKIQLEKKRVEAQRKIKQKKQAEQKKIMLKTLGRPVSATPLSILSLPKNNNTQIINLAKQYPRDKTLQTVLMNKVIPHARHPEQYGIFSQQEQIKTKSRVKAQRGKNPDKEIHNLLLKTTFEGSLYQEKNLIKEILAEQYLEDSEKWKKHLPELRDAIQVQSYKYQWVRKGLLGFSDKYMKTKYDDIDTNTIIKNVLNHITQIGENARKNKILLLNSELNSQQGKYRMAENQRLYNTQKMSQEDQLKKQQRKFYHFLQSRAKDYIKERMNQTSSPPKQTRMQYLKNLYEQAKKSHKTYVQKHFPVIQNSLPFSHLFKYEFYKKVKDINHFNLEKDKLVKNHIWAPTGSSEYINQPTFNHMVKAYSKDKSKKQNEKIQVKQKSVWNKKNQEERLKFLMTYQEAKECTFKPVIHKI